MLQDMLEEQKKRFAKVEEENVRLIEKNNKLEDESEKIKLEEEKVIPDVEMKWLEEELVVQGRNVNGK